MNPYRRPLIASLLQLSALYPSMRCGQILEMVTTLIGAETEGDFEDATDADVLREAVNHCAERLKQLGLNEISLESLSGERLELISTLRDTSFLGAKPLVCEVMRVARDLNTTLYDIEDDVLLRTLKHQGAIA